MSGVTPGQDNETTATRQGKEHPPSHKATARHGGAEGRSRNDEARMVRAGLALNDEGMTKHE